MRICGIDYSGSDLIPVVLDDSSGDWLLVDTLPLKITLTDVFDTAGVRLFAKTIETFLRDHCVDRVVIKKRSKKGPFGGGAASWRMGALVQVATEKPVEFVTAQAVNKIAQDQDAPASDGLRQYQTTAYHVALAGIGGA